MSPDLINCEIYVEFFASKIHLSDFFPLRMKSIIYSIFVNRDVFEKNFFLSSENFVPRRRLARKMFNVTVNFPLPKFKITLSENHKLKKKENVPQGGWSIISKCIFFNGHS